jgi:hypothetical protein
MVAMPPASGNRCSWDRYPAYPACLGFGVIRLITVSRPKSMTGSHKQRTQQLGQKPRRKPKFDVLLSIGGGLLIDTEGIVDVFESVDYDRWCSPTGCRVPALSAGSLHLPPNLNPTHI